MAQIIFNSPEGDKAFPLTREVTSLGRTQDNDIMIPDTSVSRKHARITLQNGQFQIEDLDSANGTFVKGRKIDKAPLKNGDALRLGKCNLNFVDDNKEAAAGASDATLSFEEKIKLKTPESQKPVSKPKPQQEDPLIKLKLDIHRQLLERMDLKKMDLSKSDDSELRASTKVKVEQIIAELSPENLRGVDKGVLVKEIVDEALGLGPLEDLLSDPEITEIMVNRKDQVYIEKKGKLQLSNKKFASDEQIQAVIERIVAPIGRRIDESMPMVDARLKDGSRVNAIIPPLALQGSTLTIRKFSDKPFQVQDLIRFGSMNEDVAEFLRICVKARKNIVISGGTGSGKTTLLNVISSFIPHDERIVTIEDAAELKLPQEHVVSLESRPPNIEGKGAITIRDLVRNALRMRPDRIVVGECRGGEALDMLQAMNTGHDGSLTTGHANSPRDILSRLETMVLMSGMELPIRAIREQLSSAVNIIVQISRLSDGSRRVLFVSEVTGMEGDVITLQDIFLFKQTGLGKDGKVQGKYLSSGFVPRFVEDLKVKGIEVNMKMFQNTE